MLIVRCMRSTLLIGLGLAIMLPPFGGRTMAAPTPEAAALEDKVIDFCKHHMGEKVGNGECAGLAFQALKAAGAKTRGGPDSPAKGDYVWGRQILLIESTPEGPKTTGQWSDVRPGDIVQYHDTKFVTAHFAHHTAIVREIDEKSLKVYQQHVNGTEIVGEGAVRLDKLANGWLRFYRPIPKE